MTVSLNLVHLYPALMNLYGDRGNIIVLSRRCAWRGIELRVHPVGLGEPFPDVPVDLLFMGGDQDTEQAVVIEDMRRHHAGQIVQLAEDGIPFLAVCGGYQLIQNYYRPADGPDLIGLGILDAHTIHPGHSVPRKVGNIVVKWNGTTIVGFENHGGRTFLHGDTTPLGSVIVGFGNNGEDKTEGARKRNVFGTYVHGSLLPKNPTLADHILSLALARRYPHLELGTLDDSLENRAHGAAIARVRDRR